jgi:hypothetical protein
LGAVIPCLRLFANSLALRKREAKRHRNAKTMGVPGYGLSIGPRIITGVPAASNPNFQNGIVDSPLFERTCPL